MMVAGKTVRHVFVNFYLKIILSRRDAFKDLVNPKEISLKKNELLEIPGHLFQPLKSIRKICLDRNLKTTLNTTLIIGDRKLTWNEGCFIE